ncbi:MAG: hypothetical protein LBV45_01005 [Xanthomonadaceae bacterium]|jgi:hypothetical protein|nr:hypothetical protein [Xanthomonadaceae bacterium]
MRLTVLCLLLIIAASPGTAAVSNLFADRAEHRKTPPLIGRDASLVSVPEHDAYGPAQRRDTGNGEIRLQPIRPPQWHRFLPGMFR